MLKSIKQRYFIKKDYCERNKILNFCEIVNTQVVKDEFCIYSMPFHSINYHKMDIFFIKRSLLRQLGQGQQLQIGERAKENK